MELTGTNRSCGLTTYFSTLRAPRSEQGGATQRPTLRFEARREKAQVITIQNIATPHSKRCLVESRGLSSNERSRDSPESLTDCMLDTKPVVLRTSPVFPGGYTGEVTPVPIPNTEVKLSRANGTAGASLWESRTLPGF